MRMQSQSSLASIKRKEGLGVVRAMEGVEYEDGEWPVSRPLCRYFLSTAAATLHVSCIFSADECVAICLVIGASSACLTGLAYTEMCRCQTNLPSSFVEISASLSLLFLSHSAAVTAAAAAAAAEEEEHMHLPSSKTSLHMAASVKVSSSLGRTPHAVCLSVVPPFVRRQVFCISDIRQNVLTPAMAIIRLPRPCWPCLPPSGRWTERCEREASAHSRSSSALGPSGRCTKSWKVTTSLQLSSL